MSYSFCYLLFSPVSSPQQLYRSARIQLQDIETTYILLCLPGTSNLSSLRLIFRPDILMESIGCLLLILLIHDLMLMLSVCSGTSYLELRVLEVGDVLRGQPGFAEQLGKEEGTYVGLVLY
jgi:hypothetical protein